MLIGIPGSGKTTYSKDLSNEYNDSNIKDDVSSNIVFNSFLLLSNSNLSKKLFIISFKELKFNTLGIQNVYSDITDIFNRKPSLYRTCTITVDVLKILSYLLSEEYNEANMDDPQLQDAFTKILNKL